MAGLWRPCLQAGTVPWDTWADLTATPPAGPHRGHARRSGQDEKSGERLVGIGGTPPYAWHQASIMRYWELWNIARFSRSFCSLKESQMPSPFLYHHLRKHIGGWRSHKYLQKKNVLKFIQGSQIMERTGWGDGSHTPRRKKWSCILIYTLGPQSNPWEDRCKSSQCTDGKTEALGVRRLPKFPQQVTEPNQIVINPEPKLSHASSVSCGRGCCHGERHPDGHFNLCSCAFMLIFTRKNIHN